MSNSFADALKRAIEAVGPDLRHILLQPVTGYVDGYGEQEFTVNVRVEKEQKEGEPFKEHWMIPNVPVNSLAGGDGWGVFVTPELESEVTVSFKNGDITDPRISGAEFLNNRPPIGGRIGSFTIMDHSGQRFSLRPDSGEVIFQAYNKADETAGGRTEATGGQKRTEVQGHLTETTGGQATKTFEMNLTEAVRGALSRTYGDADDPDHEEFTDYTDANSDIWQRAEITSGKKMEKVSGLRSVKVASDQSHVIGGDDVKTVAKNVKKIIGGRNQILAAGLRSDGVVPVPFICHELNSPPLGINVWGGSYIPGVSAPMINGALLKAAIDAHRLGIHAAMTALAGKFSGPNPVIGSDLATALEGYNLVVAGLDGVLATAVFTAISVRQFFGYP